MRIRLEHLEKEFDGVPVLRGIDFDDDVTTLAVIGPSGGGKSTLLRIVGGLIAPTAGTVEVDGERVDFDERTLPAYRASLGFVFQASGLFHHLGALENVAPVSYTHLDVYKRQPPCSRRPRACAGGRRACRGVPPPPRA